MGDEEIKSLLDEKDTIYDFEEFVKLEVLEKTDVLNSQNLNLEPLEDEKSDAKNESIGQKLEKLSKKLKKLGFSSQKNEKIQTPMVLSPNSSVDSLDSFDTKDKKLESEYSSSQEGPSDRRESELLDSPIGENYGSSDDDGIVDLKKKKLRYRTCENLSLLP